MRHLMIALLATIPTAAFALEAGNCKYESGAYYAYCGGNKFGSYFYSPEDCYQKVKSVCPGQCEASSGSCKYESGAYYAYCGGNKFGSYFYSPEDCYQKVKSVCP